VSSDLAQDSCSLITAGFHGTELTDETRRLVDAGIRSFILFGRNVRAPEQVLALTESIREYAGQPVLFSVDQEGGVVQRLRQGFTRIPAMRRLGELANEPVAFRLGELVAWELRSVGITMNYAPVLDVDTNPENPVIGARSFGPEPELVARLGVAVGQGLEAGGVASCGKHFPGHGDTQEDSHLALPLLGHDMVRLNSVELVPFRAWADAGLASVMTAHVVFSAMDPGLPATLSQVAMQTLLREELRFDGVIVSDDLEMAAIRDHYGVPEAAVRAIAAGVDQLLVCQSHGAVLAAIDSLRSFAVSRGEARVRDAAARVRRLMQRFVLTQPAAPSLHERQERRAWLESLFPNLEQGVRDPTAR
jgi:beta-N-acetylhexosaminidase